MKDKTTSLLGKDDYHNIILDLEDPKKNRDFTFDYSFWSHDDFEADENGLSIATSAKYAD
jgi:hypothetical protein